ncbi:multidrug resistance protein MdtN [Novipirellula galeiformis]|uniref:Multidrug resistance protein MdtN n=1 Tax=Novipirellula galeiformis TaxID=2528004 RepID=A0A5C6CM40_9BACT|nr:HlyD family efflux transporter periplasmic adaptor subunit [Novipirellula galeiformis]TWU24401.1 multidrug resistance protein MdtN [Novipirellula galeiformis]
MRTIKSTALTLCVLPLAMFWSGARAEETTVVEVTDCVVRFASEVHVPCVESGRVAEVYVKLNEPIEANSLIARLDDRSLKIRHRASALRLEHARRTALDDVELRYAETALAEAKAELDSNRSIQNDVSGAIPLSHIRRLRLAVERGELEVALAKKRRVEAQVEVELREADVAMLDDQLHNLEITSPLLGTVLEVSHSPGEWIEKGQSIVTVARIDRLHVHALVRQDVLPLGQSRELPISVHWIDPHSGVEKTLRGKILSVDPQMLPGARYRLHAEIINQRDEADPSRWQLIPGVEVRMKVHLSQPIDRRATSPTRFSSERLR